MNTGFSAAGRVCRAALALGMGVTLSAGGHGAADAPARNVEGIMDNSFFIEEAYNQEPGVVQHILTSAWGRDRAGGADSTRWSFAFTQEWPVFGRAHQWSYTIPYDYVRDQGGSANGFGDVQLNYRYQAWFDEDSLRAFAPRFSLVLPTGDTARGLGEDTVGYQINLPGSAALGGRWFVHGNAGATYLPDAASAARRDLWHYNLGASGIFALTRYTHLMLEWVGSWVETAAPEGRRRHRFISLIAPGVRRAFNFHSGSQLVVGAAAPFGLTDAATDYGLFLYISVEHRFHRHP
jgi:hypothetical protein